MPETYYLPNQAGVKFVTLEDYQELEAGLARLIREARRTTIGGYWWDLALSGELEADFVLIRACGDDPTFTAGDLRCLAEAMGKEVSDDAARG